jgi:hypothetical protein
MKSFKKMSVALVMGLGLAGSAFAADGLTVKGDVHGATAHQYRGYQFSDGEASIGASVTAAHTSGLYGTVKTDTIKLTNGTGRHQAQSALTVGYTDTVGAIKVDGGVTRNFFSGKDSVSDLSFSEAFIGAEYKGAYAKVSTVVEGSKLGIPGFTSGDTYGELGYTHAIGKFSVGADLGYSFHDTKYRNVKDGLSVAQLRAGYAVNDQVDVTVTHQFAGDDFYGNEAAGTHKTFVKVAYKF